MMAQLSARRGVVLRAVAILSLALGGAMFVSAQNRQLRLVSTVWPPFTDKPGSTRFALDLVEAGLGRFGVSANTALVDPAQFTAAVLNGPYDGSGAVWRDAQRETALLYSDPYLENRLVLVARRGADVKASALNALKGKKVAIVEGYSYGDDVEKSGVTLVRSKGEEDSIRLLLANSVDYVLMDELVVQYIIENYPNEAKARLQLGAQPMLRRSLHIAVRRELPDASSIIDRFNAQLRLMIADRTYHKLLHVNWIYADVDGDGQSEYVAAADQAGKAPPAQAYRLFSQDQAGAAVAKDADRYFFGGAVYNGWSSVPDKYKTDDLDRMDAQHPTARIFTFSWK